MGMLPCDCGMALAVAVAAIAVAVVAAFLWNKFGPKEAEPFLNKQRKKITLIDKTDISPDTRRLLFSLEFPNQPLGLPVGQHLRVFAPNTPGVEPGMWNGRPDPEASADEICRKYTPVSPPDTRGQVELVIKVYKKQKTPPFVDGGKMSQYIERLNIGDTLEVDGPFGRVTYSGHGRFKLGSRSVFKSRVGLIAGGTGITPIFQLIRNVFQDHTDSTQLTLIYANKTEDDILLRDELEELSNEYPDRLKVWYTLDVAPPKWKYSQGFINKQLLQQHLPPPDSATLILCCGPLPMIQNCCTNNLQDLGYSQDDVFCF